MSLSYDGDGMVKWTGHNGGYDCSPAGILGCLPRCLCLPWVMDGMAQYLMKINRLDLDMMLSKTMYAGGRRRVCTSDTPSEACSVECWTMDADRFSTVDNRAGVTFGVELYVPWNAPEMAVDLSSASAVPLRNVPDVFGMIRHRDSAIESRVLQGRDARSIRVLIPDCRGLDQNFHDVTCCGHW